MKKFLIALLSVIMCAACAFGLTACGDDSTTNPDGTPKNMLETVFDVNDSQSLVGVWENRNNAYVGVNYSLPLKKVLDGSLQYGNYCGFWLSFRKGIKEKYKPTSVKFDILAQTDLKIQCLVEFKDFDNIQIQAGQKQTIMLDVSDVDFNDYSDKLPVPTLSVNLKANFEKAWEVLDWQLKIENIFVTAEKVQK